MFFLQRFLSDATTGEHGLRITVRIIQILRKYSKLNSYHLWRERGGGSISRLNTTDDWFPQRAVAQFSTRRLCGDSLGGECGQCLSKM